MAFKTAIYRDNLAIAFPDSSPAQRDELMRRSWGRAGRVLAEYPHLGTILKDSERLQLNVHASLATCRDPSTPCVIVTAHQSNWEIVCLAMAKLGIPNVSLYSPPSNPRLNKLLMESRRALNCELLPRDNSARPLLRALRQGRTVGMVIDRRVDDGKPIEFFGRTKFSTILPAKLALKMDCDLVPVQVERLRDARFRVTFHPPVRARNKTGDETTQAIDMIQQVHEQFESWIRQKPEDWFCSKRLWPRCNVDLYEEVSSDSDIDSYAT